MKTLKHKIIACISAAALALGMLPASAIALTESDLVGESKTYVGSGTQEISTDINLVTYGGLAVERTQALDESAYSQGEPIVVYITGAAENEKNLAGTWYYAPAKYDSYGVSLFSEQRQAAEKVQNTTLDSIAYDKDLGCWVAKHIPRNDNLPAASSDDAPITYWYWLDVTAGSGLTASSAEQAVERPSYVTRQSGYRPGPLTDSTDNPWDESQGWTWAIAGAGVDEIDGHQVASNTSIGKVKMGSTLVSDELRRTSKDYRTLEEAAGTTMRTEGAWNVMVTDVVPETDAAYVGNLMVVLDANNISWPDGMMMPPRAGIEFEILRIDPNTGAAVKLSEEDGYDLSYQNGLITFYVEDSATTGEIGIYSLAIRQTSEDAARAFTIATEVSGGAHGVISSGGDYTYGAAPVFLFTPDEGYGVESLTLAIYNNKSDAVPAKTVTIKNRLADEGDSSYGTWEGNSYRLPADFNKDKDEPYAVLAVAFTAIPDNPAPDTPVTLTVKATGPGSVYVGDMQEPTRVKETERTFATGETYGTYELVKNESVMLLFAGDAGALTEVESLTIDGEEYVVEGDAHQIPKLTADMHVEVVFAYGSVTPTEHTVSVIYDKTKAQVGFGETGTVWADAAKVAHAGSVTVIVRPKAGFAVESAGVYRADVLIADVTEDAALGTIEVANVIADTEVRLMFKTLSSSFVVSDIPEGSSIVDANNNPVSAGDEFTVTGEKSVTLTITLDEGEELDLDSVRLTGSNGSMNPPVSGPVMVDGKPTYKIEVGYGDLADAGEDAALSYKLKEGGNPPGPGPDKDVYVIEGAPVSSAAFGRVSLKTEVAKGADTTIYFYPDLGYRVAYVMIDGARVPASASSAAFDIDIVSSVPHITFKAVSADHVMAVAFEKIPDPGTPDTGTNTNAKDPDPIVDTTLPGEKNDGVLPGGTVKPTNPVSGDGTSAPDYADGKGGNTTLVYKPDTDDGIVDTIVVDDVTILDKWCTELKDKMEGPGEDGLLHDSESGMAYDPATGEYVTSDDNRFRVNVDTGEVTFTSINRDLHPTGTFTTTMNLTVNVIPKMGTSDGGSTIPEGVFKWKRNLPLVVIAAPDEDKWLNSLMVDEVEWQHVQATQAHLDQLDRTLHVIERVNGAVAARAQNTTRIAALESTDSKNMSQTVSIERTIAALTGADVAYAAYAADLPALADNMRAATIPADYFTNDDSVVSIRADFGEREYSITARVEGGHATIAGAASSEAPFTVSRLKKGTTYTLNYAVDNGYRVASVIDNGSAATGFTQTAYQIASIDADHEVIIKIEPVSALVAGASDPVSRVVRRLTSLAQTGDLNMPAMIALVGVACAAMGVTVMMASRRRNREEE